MIFLHISKKSSTFAVAKVLNMAKLLIIDDERGIRNTLKEILADTIITFTDWTWYFDTA